MRVGFENNLQLKSSTVAPDNARVAGSAESFGQLIRTESVRLGRVVRDSGVVTD